MRLIKRRDYNTKGRLGFEGLYLEQSDFKKGSLIDYSINFKNKSILIKLSKKKTNKTNIVTQNVTRSGKTVPAICIRNKSIESFINSTPNLEILIFNGVIIISSKDCDSNILFSQAILAHNNSLKENYRRVLQLLIDMRLLSDDILLSDFDLSDKYNILSTKRIQCIPTKIITKLKKSFKKAIFSNIQHKSRLCNCLSNSLILASIFKDNKDTTDDEEDENNDILENVLELFIGQNHNTVSHYYNRIISIQVNDILLKDYNSKCRILKSNLLIGCQKGLDRILMLLVSILKEIHYLIKILNNVILYKGLYFILFRKEINTLSPPSNIK